MKKTLVTAFLAGSSMALFAQTTPPVTAPPVINPVTTTPVITSPTMSTPVTTTPATTSPATNNSVTNSTSDPLNTVTNQQANTTGTYSPSTSWDATGTPYWGWNNYGIWNNNTAVNGAANTSANTGIPTNSNTPASTNSTMNSNSTMNGSATMNSNTTMNGNTTLNSNSTMNGNTSINGNTPMSGSTPMNNTAPVNNTDMNSGAALTSGNTYSAYSGTPVSALPGNVQTNFSKAYPNSDNSQYTWNQYGDWFGTYHTAKGRTTQYYYDQSGSGYSLSLPVIQTYVPEEIVDKALNKYGAHLYSIGMIKTADGNSAYQVGLIDRGQLHNEYLSEQGATVANVWRTEEMNINSTSTNAAMDNQSGVAPTTNQSSDANADMGGTSTDAGNYQDSTGKSKMKTKSKNGDGTATGTKNKSGKMKAKMNSRKNDADSMMNPSGRNEQ